MTKKNCKILAYVVAFGVTGVMLWHRFSHPDIAEIRWLIDYWHVLLLWMLGMVFSWVLWLYGIGEIQLTAYGDEL